ncbi:lysophospholipase L1-like esterase [Micromonospora sp. A200]|uniref:SGNH/GDSL hydrolase family protein n=1 Tax=Micromonospora sp. A200 TaxID=2940568 RepID=UPI002475D20C|nr:SGNH/GDSL hydrolase family protein [Micromonospora sp. A200]MDH6460107.1 lysophospholipase L1-like esterase [Micromonospora sp. A200]
MSDWTFINGDDATVGEVTGKNAVVVGGVTIAFWSAETGGSQYTDLLDSDGVAVPVIVSADGATARAAGQIPPFQGPDGVTEVWASANGGPRSRMVANIGGDFVTVEQRVSAVEGVAGAAETPAGAQAKADAAEAAAQSAAATDATTKADAAQAAAIAASASRPAAFQRGHRWAFIGDSITNGSAASNFSYSYASRAIALAGHNLIRPDSFEAGVPGERSDQMLARLAAVEASGATSFVVLAGTNDAGQGVSVTSYASTMTQIITRLRALGQVLVGTVPPRGASDPAAFHTAIDGYNAWLRVFAPLLGAQVVDVWGALVDTTTGRLPAAYDSGDGTHPNTLGHLRMARVVAAAIRASGPAWPGWVTSEGQPGNYITDALCDSGTVRPSGWFEWPSGTGTPPTYSLVTDTTGRLPAGKWATVDINAAAATSRVLSSPAIPVTAGDRLALCLLAEVDDLSGDWEATANAATAWNARVVNQTGAAIASARTTRAVGYSVVAGTYRMPPLLWPFTLPAGTTSANIWLEHTLSAGQHYTFRYGCIGLINLTTLGMQSLLDFGSNSMVSLA